MKTDNEVLRESLTAMLLGVEVLAIRFEKLGRRFTLDGRLLGDIGEIIAWQNFDLILDEKSQDTHDATFGDGLRVNIKVTLKDKIHIRKIPDYCLALKLHPDASYEVIYNGPGNLILQRWQHLKGIGVTQIGFENTHLSALDKSVPAGERVPLRTTPPRLEDLPVLME